MARKLRVAAVGSRTFEDFKKFQNAMAFILESNLTEKFSGVQLVSGGADGADSLAERFSLESEGGVKIEVLHANWDEFGRVAGFKRNTSIVNSVDIVLAFWDGKSRGTKDTIDKAVKANKPVFIFPAGKPKKLPQ